MAVPPPDKLDGATVLQWAWSGATPFCYMPVVGEDFMPMIDEPVLEIYGLAICQYDNHSNVYRFSCDKNWEVQQDSEHISLEDAIEHLPEQYKLVAANWQVK